MTVVEFWRDWLAAASFVSANAVFAFALHPAAAMSTSLISAFAAARSASRPLSFASNAFTVSAAASTVMSAAATAY